MNRGRLRRYALRVLAAASLGVALIATAGGIANAGTISGGTVPTTVIRVIPGYAPAGEVTANDYGWG